MPKIESRKQAESIRRYARRWFNREWPQRREHISFCVRDALEAAGAKFGVGYGVEGIRFEPNSWASTNAIDYLNMGDTYDLTVLFDYRTNRFLLGSYGDAVESAQRNGRYRPE